MARPSMKFAYLLNHRQDPWLCIVVSVRTDSQIDFLLKRIVAVRGHQPEERVFWCLRYPVRSEDRRS